MFYCRRRVLSEFGNFRRRYRSAARMLFAASSRMFFAEDLSVKTRQGFRFVIRRDDRRGKRQRVVFFQFAERRSAKLPGFNQTIRPTELKHLKMINGLDCQDSGKAVNFKLFNRSAVRNRNAVQ